MQSCCRPRGLMDKASDFESEDCRFDPCRGRSKLHFFNFNFKSIVLQVFLILILNIVAFKREAVAVRVA